MKYIKTIDVWDMFMRNRDYQDCCPKFEDGRLHIVNSREVDYPKCSDCDTWAKWRKCWGEALSKISVEK